MINDYDGIMPTDDTILKKIQKDLPEFIKGRRLEHTYGVEKTAIRLSEVLFNHLGINPLRQNDIRAAALLHDITKQFSETKQQEHCHKYGIDIGNFHESEPIIHAKTGAYFSKEAYGINDIVFNCIYNHTTGRENMSVFEKIIFISDYIEDTRTSSPCIKVRNKLLSSLETEENKLYCLDCAILESINYTLEYLLEKNSCIDIQTVNTRNFILAEYTLQNSVHEVLK